VYIQTRVNAIVNRLNKTKVVREVDHEAEKIARQKEGSRKKKAEAIQQVVAPSLPLTCTDTIILKKNELEELKKQRQAEAEARSYDSLFKQVEEDEDYKENVDPDDFM
jgi:hypothetical protein